MIEDGTPWNAAASPEALARIAFGDELFATLTMPEREATLCLAEYALHMRNVATVAEIDGRARQAHTDVLQHRQDRDLPKRIRAAFAAGLVASAKQVAYVVVPDATDRDREAVRHVVLRLAKRGEIIEVHQHRGHSGAKVYAASKKLRRELFHERGRKSRNPPRDDVCAVVLERPAMCPEVLQ